MNCKDCTIKDDIFFGGCEKCSINILTLWLYWIIVGEPDKRDSLNRKEE